MALLGLEGALKHYYYYYYYYYTPPWARGVSGGSADCWFHSLCLCGVKFDGTR